MRGALPPTASGALLRVLKLNVVWIALAVLLSLAYAGATTAVGWGLVAWRPCGGWSTMATRAAVWISVLAPVLAASPPILVLVRGGSLRRAGHALLWSLGALLAIWLVFNQTFTTCT